MDLIGERVLLRRARVEDAGALAAIFSIPEIARYTGPGLLLPETVEDRRREIEAQATVAPDAVAWNVVDRADGTVLGNAGLFNVDLLNRNCWFAITLGPPQRLGRGLGTEAVRLVTRFGLRRLGLEKVRLSVFEGNDRARRAYEKSGYVLEAERRRQHFLEGRMISEYWMAAFRDHPLYR
ncbi:MAG: GNAT family N-acetyltransferase [Candidatus Dormibacteraceae bacterium]